MLGHQPYYFKTIRKLTTAFGTMFNDIDIVRKNSDDTEFRRYRVPLKYGPKNSWLVRENSLATIDNDAPSSNVSGKSKLQMIYPIISYELTTMNYAPNRQLNSGRYEPGAVVPSTVPETPATSKHKQFGGVPWDFVFTLTVHTKYVDDGIQILEQILPYFAPSVNIKIKEVYTPTHEVVNDVRFKLDNVSSSDNYVDGFGDARILTWDLTFTCGANLYPSINDSKFIRKVTVNNQNALIDPPDSIEDVIVEAHPDENENRDNSTTTITPT